MPVQSAPDLEILKAPLASASTRLLTMQHPEKQQQHHKDHRDPGSSSPISPSFSVFSPSPYIINCKKRGYGAREAPSGEGKSKDEEAAASNVYGDCPEEQANPASHLGTSRLGSLNDQLIELKDALEKFISDCSSSEPRHFREEERGNADVGIDFQALRRKNVRAKILAEILTSRKAVTGMKLENDEVSTTKLGHGECQADSSPRSSSESPSDEFFDARDASSSDGYSSNEDGSVSRRRKQHSSLLIDSELVRQLHMEVKRRMQVEEALQVMHQCQQNIVNILLSPSCSTPPRSTSPPSTTSINHGLASLIEEDWQSENCLRTVIATVISSALLRGVIRTDEAEALEKLLETKDRESSRLRRKLKFFEHVNNELSRKNQEATERARRIRRNRQKWLSVSAKCLLVGTAVGVSGILLYWYFPWERLKPARKEIEAPLTHES